MINKVIASSTVVKKIPLHMKQNNESQILQSYKKKNIL